MTNNARYNGKASFDEWKKEWALEERYNFHTIEEKWQKIWDDEKAYKVEIDKNKEKFYALVEFPYPSGAGLVGSRKFWLSLVFGILVLPRPRLSLRLCVRRWEWTR